MIDVEIGITYDTVSDRLERAGFYVSDLARSIYKQLEAAFDGSSAAITTSRDRLVVKYGLPIAMAGDYVADAIKRIETSAEVDYDKIFNFISTGQMSIQDSIADTFWNLYDTIVDTSDTIKDSLLDRIGEVKYSIESVIGYLSDKVTGGFSSIETVVSDVSNTVSSGITNLLSQIENLFSPAFDNFRSTLEDLINLIPQSLTNLFIDAFFEHD